MHIDDDFKKSLWHAATYLICAALFWCIGAQTMASCHISGDLEITTQLLQTLKTINIIIVAIGFLIILLAPIPEYKKDVHRAQRASRKHARIQNKHAANRTRTHH